MTLPVVVVGLLVAVAVGVHSGGGGHKAVRRAPVVGVPSTIAEDCSRPADQDINAFLAQVPDGSTIVFGPGRCYAEDGPLRLTDRRSLTIDGNGSTFKAVGDDVNTCRPNWLVEGGQDITLQNFTLIGRNPGGWDGPRVPNTVGQCEHGVTFGSTQGGALRNAKVANVYGDPVSIEPDGRKQDFCAVPPARNIVVDGLEAVNAGRTVAITDGDGITIRNSHFVDMFDAAIDLEPDVPCEYVRDIHILGNRFGRYRYALLNVYTSNVPADHSGQLEFSNNVAEVEPYSCYAPIFFTAGGVAEPAPQFHGVTIAGNNLKTLGLGIWLDHVTQARVEGNTLSKDYGTGCANPNVATKFYGLFLTDSHDVSQGGNVLVNGPRGGFDGDLHADDASTGVSTTPAR